MSTTRGTERRSRATVLRRHGVRALTAGAALAGALMAVAGPAHATANVSVSGSVLQIDSDAASDNVLVTQVGNRLVIRNDGGLLIPAAPCVATAKNVSVCPAEGVTTIVADLGDGDDRLENRTLLRSRAVLGAGADQFVGGAGVDMAFGDVGNDRLAGNAGDDVLLGADGLDSAHGGDGVDKCDAEILTACE
ncbi:calcium-binding protein [Nonomuraea sp. NPDC050404]|uniref:calcium-binding protein n=1 Tax=Nonomuraea sp. NPDC050404 TaxID=3155783 RepID=UPI0033FA2A70